MADLPIAEIDVVLIGFGGGGTGGGLDEGEVTDIVDTALSDADIPGQIDTAVGDATDGITEGFVPYVDPDTLQVAVGDATDPTHAPNLGQVDDETLTGLSIVFADLFPAGGVFGLGNTAGGLPTSVALGPGQVMAANAAGDGLEAVDPGTGGGGGPFDDADIAPAAGIQQSKLALDVVEVDDFPLGTTPAGTEVVFGVQSLAGVKFTLQQIADLARAIEILDVPGARTVAVSTVLKTNIDSLDAAIGGLTAADIPVDPPDLYFSGNVEALFNEVAAYLQAALAKLFAYDDDTRFEDFTKFDTTVTADGGRLVGTFMAASLSGTGSQVSEDDLTDIMPGGAVASTGTTTTGIGGVSFARCVCLFLAAVNVTTFGARARLTTLSTAGEQHEVRIGLVKQVTAALTDGMYFRAQHGDTNWEAVNVRASVETVVGTGVAIGTTYKNFRVKYDSATGNAVYSIDGTTVATISTNKPTDTTILVPTCSIHKAAGTTARTLRVDAAYYSNRVFRDLGDIQ